MCSVVKFSSTSKVAVRKAGIMSATISQLVLSILVVVSCTCLVTSAVLPSNDETDLSIIGLPEMKRSPRDDISKILLKNLRFRETNEMEEPVVKRQKMLVNNLAAILSGLKQRQVEPSMRMPSLRFGK